nr:hypothetical protein [Angustibacter aerolatus]
MTDTAKRVLLAAPRGYCAGVDRAVQAVEQALDLYGAPVYVRKQIVHNVHVVRTLEQRGAIFVDETDEVPEGATVVFSAHGVAPTVHQDALRLQARTIDATCPLVTKVHNEARRFASDDFEILLIGHEGHEEVVGTAGEAPDNVQARRRTGRRRHDRGARPRAAGVAVADHAVGRRDARDGATAEGALPEPAGPAQRRHLLRHPEPPGGGEGDRAAVEPDDRRGLAQLVELGAAGRGGARARVARLVPDRLRRRDRRDLAGRRHHGGRDERGERARGAGAGRARLPRRARLRRRRGGHLRPGEPALPGAARACAAT